MPVVRIVRLENAVVVLRAALVLARDEIIGGRELCVGLHNIIRERGGNPESPERRLAEIDAVIAKLDEGLALADELTREVA